MKEYVKIINIIDKSGSMNSMLETAINGFNEFIIEQKSLDGDALVSTILFDSHYQSLYEDMDVKDCYLLTKDNYKPSSMTALYDAIGYSLDNEIDKLGNLPLEERPIKTLCIILTDGQENCSKKYSNVKIKEMITEMKKDFNWEFIFLGASEDASLTAEIMGISTSNSYAFTNNSDGLKDAYKGVNYASTVYRSSAKMDNLDFESSSLMDDYKKSKK